MITVYLDKYNGTYEIDGISEPDQYDDPITFSIIRHYTVMHLNVALDKAKQIMELLNFKEKQS